MNVRKKSDFLSEYVTNQYPIDKFKKLIFISIDIVQAFLISLEEGYDYSLSSIALYTEKYGSSVRNNNSKIESILIKNMSKEEDMIKFLSCYFRAYMLLNDEEKLMFNLTFIDKLSDMQIIVKYDTYPDHIQLVRKNTIVKFCLKSGLDKFVDAV